MKEPRFRPGDVLKFKSGGRYPFIGVEDIKYIVYDVVRSYDEYKYIYHAVKMQANIIQSNCKFRESWFIDHLEKVDHLDIDSVKVYLT